MTATAGGAPNPKAGNVFDNGAPATEFVQWLNANAGNAVPFVESDVLWLIEKQRQYHDYMLPRARHNCTVCHVPMGTRIETLIGRPCAELRTILRWHNDKPVVGQQLDLLTTGPNINTGFTHGTRAQRACARDRSFHRAKYWGLVRELELTDAERAANTQAGRLNHTSGRWVFTQAGVDFMTNPSLFIPAALYIFRDEVQGASDCWTNFDYARSRPPRFSFTTNRVGIPDPFMRMDNVNSPLITVSDRVITPGRWPNNQEPTDAEDDRLD